MSVARGESSGKAGKVVNISDVVASEAMSEGLTMFADWSKDKRVKDPKK